MFLLLLALFVHAFAYSTIAGSCDSPGSCMSQSPGVSITLTAPSTQFQRGVPIQITMRNTGGSDLAGFMLFATGSTSDREGSWTVGRNMQIITCGNDPISDFATICHSSNLGFSSSIVFTFTPSSTSASPSLTFQGIGVLHVQQWNRLSTLTLTRGPDVTPTPGVTPTPPIVPTPTPTIPSDLWDMEALGYTYSVDVGHGMTFYWQPLLSGNDTAYMAIRAPASGYVAAGFTDGSWRMLNSDIVLGYPGFASIFYPTSQDLSGSGMFFNDRLTSISDTSAQQVDGLTTLVFSRNVSDGYNPITAEGQFTIIAAYSQDTGVTKHTRRSNIAYVINVQDGTLVGTVSGSWNRRVAHGVMAGVAFTLILPLGALVARGRQWLGKSWLNIHLGFQFFGFLIAVAAIIIGYTTPVVQFAPGVWHAPLGTVIFILLWIQVFGGIVRPHAADEGEKPSVPRLIFAWFHRILAFILFALAIAQIVEGILLLTVPYWAYAIWAPFAGVMILAWLLIEVLRLVSDDDSGSSSDFPSKQSVS